ncbi:MAG: hypothetical protein DWQ04_21985 [Chloroflexi bacterium]|nr:MAG: hypothetical protein DWQ04_21985 [Chloroflexota bacterium]
MVNQEKWQKMLKEQRLPHQLRIQSQQIDKVLHHRQMEAQVSGGVITPKSIQYSLQTHLSSGFERLRELKQDVLTALGVSDVKISQEGGQWHLRVNRVESPPVAFLDMLSLLPDVAPGTAVLGLNEEGSPVLLDLTDPDLAHWLLVGDFGAGKTTLLRSLAVSFSLLNKQSQLQLIVLNADKGDSSGFVELEPLSYLPHLLEPVASDVKDGLELLQFLVQETNYRIEQKVEHPKIVLLIDHLVTFLEASDEAAFEAILQLTQKGADAGIHLIMSTDRPESALLTAVFKSTVPVRIIGRIDDQQIGVSVTGNSEIHPDYLLGEGDFIAIANDEAIHFQAAYIGDYDLHLTLDALHRNRPRPLVAHAFDVKVPINEPPAPEPDPEPEIVHFKFDGQNQSWEKPDKVEDEIPFEAGINWQTDEDIEELD